MGKNKAVCIRCGTFKKQALSVCPQCGLQPKTDFEAARALILSEKTLIGSLEVGHSLEELQDIAQAIRRGKPFPIDGEYQTQVVREYYRHLNSVPQANWPRRRVLKWMAILLLMVLLATTAAWWLWRQ